MVVVYSLFGYAVLEFVSCITDHDVGMLVLTIVTFMHLVRVEEAVTPYARYRIYRNRYAARRRGRTRRASAPVCVRALGLGLLRAA